jgi:lambda repressor-like predicted transcriptional regulator
MSTFGDPVAPPVPIAGLAERIEAGRIAKGWTKAELCDRAGLKQQRYATVMKRGGPKYLQRIAVALGVRVEWLTTGAFPPEWSRPGLNMQSAAAQAQYGRSSEDDQNGQASTPGRSGNLPLHIAAHIPVIGVVTAGAGWAEPSQDPDDHQPIPIPSHWRAVTIQGDSGYPVVWNGQTVLVDDRLPLKHNRLVVVQTEDRRAYLKRYCVCDAVASGFILSSVNIGRDSFALQPEQAVSMSVVVGTLFTDSVVKS